MAKKKRQQLAELGTFPNVFDKALGMKGRWNSEFFNHDHRIVLELACGKGDYTVALARKHPQQNYIGVDIKGVRLWRGAKTALEENLKNIAFLRAPIENITDYFETGEVDEIWITFPDPYPKKRHEKHRLTAPHYMDLYRSILKPGSRIHLKTDDGDFFQYTLEMAEKIGARVQRIVEDVHASAANDELLTIRTYYEEKFLRMGRTIKYLCMEL